MTDEEQQAWEREHGLLEEGTMPTAPSGAKGGHGDGEPEVFDAARAIGYSPLLHTPLTPAAAAMLRERRAAAGGGARGGRGEAYGGDAGCAGGIAAGVNTDDAGSVEGSVKGGVIKCSIEGSVPQEGNISGRGVGASAGFDVLPEVKGRPYRVATALIHISPDLHSRLLLPVRVVHDAQGGGGGEAGKSERPPTTPLIPFSPKWLQRRPTWSR